MTKQTRTNAVKDKIEKHLGRKLTDLEVNIFSKFHFVLIRYPDICQIILEHEKGPEGYYHTRGH